MIHLELVIRHPEGKPDITCPIFVCDFCRKKIEHLWQGMYHWKEDEKGRPIAGSVVILHKERCADIIEAREGKITPWAELRWLLGYLPNNYDVSWAKLIEEYCPDDQLKQVRTAVQKRLKDEK